MTGWQAVTPDEADGTHVVPTSDITLHALTEDCICGPTPELVTTAGGDAWMFTHHSLDGRELAEDG